jgi:hypothetical protein
LGALLECSGKENHKNYYQTDGVAESIAIPYRFSISPIVPFALKYRMHESQRHTEQQEW